MVRRRRMVRAYQADRPVPAAVLQRALEHAIRAPSAGFSQGWDFVVLSEPADRQRFWDTTTGGEPDSWLAGMTTAPVLVLCLSDPARYLDRYAEPDKGWTDRNPDRWSAPYWFVDGGMAALAMLLTATDAGLGACFFGIPTQRIGAVRETFGVPEGLLNVGVISLGYAASGGATGSPARRPRRRPDELIHREAW